MLPAAPQPESGGGNPGAQPAPGHPGKTARQRRAPWRIGELPVRRHRGIHLRRRARRILFPGSEHPPAGGTRRHRSGVRRRPGGLDGDAGRRRTTAAGRRLPEPWPRHGSAHLRRGRAQGFPAQPRRTHRGVVPGRHPSGRLGGHRHPGEPALRPDARQGDRARRRPPGGAEENAGRPGRHAALRHRHQPGLPAPHSDRPERSGRQGLHPLPGKLPVHPHRLRGGGAGHLHHGAGLPRPRRLLGHRRAAVRADGRLRLPARQPYRRQPRQRRRPGGHTGGPVTQIPQRHRGGAHRRRLRRHPGRRAGTHVAAGAGESRPDTGHRQGVQRLPHLHRGAQRHRRARLPGQQGHLRTRPVRRPRWPHPAQGRRAVDLPAATGRLPHAGTGA